MNVELLKTRAEQLKHLLQTYDPKNVNALQLLQVLGPTLDAAMAGNIATPYPIGAVPCGRILAKGKLQNMPDIENAFAAFMNELIGELSIS